MTVIRHVDEPLSEMVNFTMPGKAYRVIAAQLSEVSDHRMGQQIAIALGVADEVAPRLAPGQVPYRLAGEARGVRRYRTGGGFKLDVWLIRFEAEFLAVLIDDILDGDRRDALDVCADKTERSRTRRALKDCLAAIERALT